MYPFKYVQQSSPDETADELVKLISVYTRLPLQPVGVGPFDFPFFVMKLCRVLRKADLRTFPVAAMLRYLSDLFAFDERAYKKAIVPLTRVCEILRVRAYGYIEVNECRLSADLLLCMLDVLMPVCTLKYTPGASEVEACLYQLADLREKYLYRKEHDKIFSALASRIPTTDLADAAICMQFFETISNFAHNSSQRKRLQKLTDLMQQKYGHRVNIYDPKPWPMNDYEINELPDFPDGAFACTPFNWDLNERRAAVYYACKTGNNEKAFAYCHACINHEDANDDPSFKWIFDMIQVGLYFKDKHLAAIYAEYLIYDGVYQAFGFATMRSVLSDAEWKAEKGKYLAAMAGSSRCYDTIGILIEHKEFETLEKVLLHTPVNVLNTYEDMLWKHCGELMQRVFDEVLWRNMQSFMTAVHKSDLRWFLQQTELRMGADWVQSRLLLAKACFPGKRSVLNYRRAKNSNMHYAN